MIYEDLIRLYTEAVTNLKSTDVILSKRLKEKNLLNIVEYGTEVKCYTKFSENIKTLLVDNFLSEIEKEIPILEEEYKKQEEFSRSIWESYGSELAGDYNKGEVNALKKLNIYRSLLKK